MSDRPLIFSGLSVFLALVTLPFWARTSPKLDWKRPVAAKKCVADTALMRRSHMEMLNAWRDRRVREGVVTEAGYQINLTRTCLDQCHGNKADFCDRCHNYVGLSGPNCWDCHNAPAGSAQ